MGLGKSKSESTTRKDPFGPAASNIDSVLSQARDLEGKRALAPVDPLQFEAANQLESAARSGTNIADPALGFAGGILGGAGGAGLDTLNASARGDFLPGQGNDNLLDQVINNRQIDTSDVIRRMAASQGRGGSPAETGILARELGKIGLEANLNQFNTGRNQQLESSRALIGGGQQALNNIPGLTQAAGFNADLLSRAGEIRSNAAQQELDDPFVSAQRQSSLALPIAGQFGTTNQQGSKTASPLTQIQQGVGIGTSLFGTGISGGLFGAR